MVRKQPVIDLSTILGRIWRQKLILFGVLGFCLLACVVYLHAVHFKYSVTLKVTAVEDQPRQIKGTLSDLASAAGIALPNDDSGHADSFELFLQNIYGRETANDLASDHSLMQTMFPLEWNAQTKQWRDPEDLLHEVLMGLSFIVGIPTASWAPPNGVRVQQFIARNVRILRDLKSPIVTIEMDHEDSQFGIQFLSKLHQIDDGRLRARALSRTTKYIDYLNEELRRVANEDYRKALIDLLADQEKRRMFASSPSISFAAEPFEAPTASALPDTPNSTLALILSTAIGILFGGFVAFFWDNFRHGLGPNDARPSGD